MAKRKKWTREEETYLIELVRQGTKTQAEIGKLLGRSASAVSSRLSVLKEMGVRFPDNDDYVPDRNRLAKVRREYHESKDKTGQFRGGYREHLDVTVRSSWESNFLTYLDHKKIPWEFEPQVFYFSGIKRGTRSYLPDVKIYPNRKNYEWIEIKGRMTSKDKTKMRRLRKYYPEEFARMKVVTKNDRVASTRFYVDEMELEVYAFYDDLMKKYSGVLKNWEG